MKENGKKENNLELENIGMANKPIKLRKLGNGVKTEK